MITYFKSQRDLADTLIKIIDSYWSLQISEPDLIDYLNKVYENNKDKVYKQKKITSVVSQRLGKKRLNLLIQILNLEEVLE